MDRNIQALGVGQAIRSFGAALFSPFLALYMHNVLGLSFVEVGLLIVVLGVLPIFAGVAGGLLTDRWGRRNLYLWTLVGEAGATLGLAYGMGRTSLAILLGFAVLGGGISSLGQPANSAYIADLSTGSARTRGFTWYRIGHNAGFAAGVALGGLLVTYFAVSYGEAGGFATVTALSALFEFAAIVGMALVLDPSPYDLKLREGRLETAAPKARLPSWGASLRAIARDRIYLEFCLGSILVALVAGQWNVTFPLFVNADLGIGYNWLGLGLAINGLVVVFGQTLTTESMIGRRHTTIFILGTVAYVVGFLLLAADGVVRWELIPVFFAMVVVLTLGENLTAIPMAVLPSNLAPPLEVGSYNGGYNFVLGLGYILATFEGGAVLSATANPLAVWVLLAVPAIPALLLLRRLARRVPLAQDTA